MTTAATRRYEELREMTADILEIDPADLTPTSRFVEDHASDSLHALELLACIERRYAIEIPQAELARMSNLQAVYDIVRTSAGWQE
ncbi:polyketide-8 synthase acyl carrier protein [Streptomyces albus subsp. albus]|nr:polyketide-8 synthase acyl carrier protein [Streptomyces albus subsp. albus]